MKVERQVEALEEKQSVDTDRCSVDKGGNDRSVMWLNERKHFTGEQRFWQTMMNADTWDFSRNLKFM